MLTLKTTRLPSLGELRERTQAFWFLCVAHLRVHWLTYLSIWGLWLVASANYVVGFNQTASLPQSVFVIHKNEPVAKGDYVAFRVPPAAAKNFKSADATLMKIVVGVEGDEVAVVDRIVHLNGKPVGYAKPRSRKGEPLEPIENVIVPQGSFYVMGLHKDSLDSRYTIVGLVPQQSVVGRAYPLF